MSRSLENGDINYKHCIKHAMNFFIRGIKRKDVVGRPTGPHSAKFGVLLQRRAFQFAGPCEGMESLEQRPP